VKSLSGLAHRPTSLGTSGCGVCLSLGPRWSHRGRGNRKQRPPNNSVDKHGTEQWTCAWPGWKWWQKKVEGWGIKSLQILSPETSARPAHRREIEKIAKSVIALEESTMSEMKRKIKRLQVRFFSHGNTTSRTRHRAPDDVFMSCNDRRDSLRLERGK
jgi:hypothetical protein